MISQKDYLHDAREVVRPVPEDRHTRGAGAARGAQAARQPLGDCLPDPRAHGKHR